MNIIWRARSHADQRGPVLRERGSAALIISVTDPCPLHGYGDARSGFNYCGSRGPKGVWMPCSNPGLARGLLPLHGYVDARSVPDSPNMDPDGPHCRPHFRSTAISLRKIKILPCEGPELSGPSEEINGRIDQDCCGCHSAHPMILFSRDRMVCLHFKNCEENNISWLSLFPWGRSLKILNSIAFPQANKILQDPCLYIYNCQCVVSDPYPLNGYDLRPWIHRVTGTAKLDRYGRCGFHSEHPRTYFLWCALRKNEPRAVEWQACGIQKSSRSFARPCAVN